MLSFNIYYILYIYILEYTVDEFSLRIVSKVSEEIVAMSMFNL